ncbi:uncharacterized protein PgNI_12279 [Pyricularia grisea]|uniref:Uncharacterized protein n=1 Tax=Pyricularia grisea TaxID=148305 RepID=A0A6P8AMN2_PYRGI|nr:uncharacterized protein PgNI_12279 [Pyricularia grisea]TLD03310.1 hypothetical protein PgNI_12279 [Pyricularia grisea]
MDGFGRSSRQDRSLSTSASNRLLDPEAAVGKTGSKPGPTRRRRAHGLMQPRVAPWEGLTYCVTSPSRDSRPASIQTSQDRAPQMAMQRQPGSEPGDKWGLSLCEQPEADAGGVPGKDASLAIAWHPSTMGRCCQVGHHPYLVCQAPMAKYG